MLQSKCGKFFLKNQKKTKKKKERKTNTENLPVLETGGRWIVNIVIVIAPNYLSVPPSSPPHPPNSPSSSILIPLDFAGGRGGGVLVSPFYKLPGTRNPCALSCPPILPVMPCCRTLQGNDWHRCRGNKPGFLNSPCLYIPAPVSDNSLPALD